MSTSPNNYFLGFVTAGNFADVGFCGGYLILNQLGHPSEFHCTIPVRPNRTQEILYGARLNNYLIGHQIVPALLAKTKLRPEAILVDDPNAISIESSLKYPLAIVDLPTVASEDDAEDRLTERNSNSVQQEQLPSHLSDWKTSRIGDLWTVSYGLEDGPPHSDSGDFEYREIDSVIAKTITEFATKFTLDEPFQRIQEALSEAQNAAAA